MEMNVSALSIKHFSKLLKKQMTESGLKQWNICCVPDVKEEEADSGYLHYLNYVVGLSHFHLSGEDLGMRVVFCWIWFSFSPTLSIHWSIVVLLSFALSSAASTFGLGL